MKDVLTPAYIIFLALCLVEDMDIDAILANAGINPARLTEPDGMISAAEVAAIVESTNALSNDPALGLHVGEEIGVEMLDLMGMLVSTAPNLREAITCAQNSSRLISTLGHIELREQGDEAAVVLHLIAGPTQLHIDGYAETVAAACISIIRRLVRGQVHLRALHCRHPEPAWVDEYRRIFGEETELVFNAPEYAMHFDRQLLDLPMSRHSPGLYQHLRAEAARRLASRPERESSSASVQRLIDEALGETVIDLPLIAARMGLNPRTLQRRLHEEGGNFSLILEACRYRCARDWIGQSERSVEDLAAHLGYSEPAVFYRAFKNWSGFTPNEYRQRHLHAPRSASG